jgi:hypothetical protein
LAFELRGFVFGKQALYCFSHTSSPFCSGYFGDGVLATICLGWPGTGILLISAFLPTRFLEKDHNFCTFNNMALISKTSPEEPLTFVFLA